MSTIESNYAAWITSKEATTLEVLSGPNQTNPEADEIIIRVAAVAINPSDPVFLENPDLLQLEYPHVLGSDVAGTVVKIGPEVTRFKPGDRVVGHCQGLTSGGARHGGFQSFSACREPAVARIPDSLPFEQAAVLPLSISTSAVALYEQLKLRLPTPELTATGGEVVLIWGGATSIGSSAVQLAVASGYRVITTASAKNHDYVRSLVPTGAEDVTVFDYADTGLAARIVSHIRDSGLTLAGAYDCISLESTIRVVAEVLHSFGGGLISTVLLGLESPREDVKLDMVWATDAALPDKEGSKVWRDFVPQALERGTFVAQPKAQVVGKGLDKIQSAIDLYKKGGVSAAKLVVIL